jgi:hypothetical protein
MIEQVWPGDGGQRAAEACQRQPRGFSQTRGRGPAAAAWPAPSLAVNGQQRQHLYRGRGGHGVQW